MVGALVDFIFPGVCTRPNRIDKVKRIAKMGMGTRTRMKTLQVSTRPAPKAMTSEDAIKFIVLAQEEAHRLGHNYLGTEHILLALIGDETSTTAMVLESMGINLDDARVEVEKIIDDRDSVKNAPMRIIGPFTPRPEVANQLICMVICSTFLLQDASPKIIGRGSGKDAPMEVIGRGSGLFTPRPEDACQLICMLMCSTFLLQDALVKNIGSGKDTPMEVLDAPMKIICRGNGADSKDALVKIISRPRGSGFEIPSTPRLEDTRQLICHHFIGSWKQLVGLVQADRALIRVEELFGEAREAVYCFLRVLGEYIPVEVTKGDEPGIYYIALADGNSDKKTPTAPAKSNTKMETRTAASKSRSKMKTPTLDRYGTDLTKLAEEDKLEAVVGRQSQIERVTQILGRLKKNNPCLIGEPGVGKTAIAEGLAQRIVNNDVPRAIQGKKVISLDMGSLVAGTEYRGEFEKRLKKLMEEIKQSRDVIVFIDEVHTLIGAGHVVGSLDAANMLKPALARGEFQCIGATTLDEYRKYIEKDPALERRFQPVKVPEPSVDETIHILKGIQSRYEIHHNLRYTDDALVAAAHLSHRYISDRFLPDKAIDLIDEAGSRSTDVVTEADIQDIVTIWTGIPVANVSGNELDHLLKMEQTLHTQIIGQDEAVKAVSHAIRRGRLGLKNPNRPIASLMFSGPTGVGKSQLAKSLATHLFGSEEAMIRLDMSEYMEMVSVSKLIGSPPGYVGYREGGQLTEAVRRRPYTIVLFDEIEKAHLDVLNIMLQILEDGRLTDSQGRTVDFKNTLVIMTSNVGSNVMEMGFDGEDERIRSLVMEELKQRFRPEFLNRVDETIVFKQLTKMEVRRIAEITVNEVLERLEEKGIEVEVGERFYDRVVEEGYNPSYGARSVRRAITRLLEDKMAEKMIAGEIKEGDSVTVDVDSKGNVTVMAT